jgi:dihydrofolate reductase
MKGHEMSKLIYLAIASLDGYIEDERGRFDWAAPDEEVHAFANDLTRPIGTFYYGRRMYETMRAWESITDGGPVMTDFAGLWRAADKVVFSRTLESTSTERTRIEREFRPDSIRSWLATSPRAAAVGGAELASAALTARLVDEYQLIVAPYVAGGGKKALPDGVQLRLELQDERRFRAGMVYLRYRIEYADRKTEGRSSNGA